MAGPKYTIAQTRARVAALEICAEHLAECVTRDEIEAKQFNDVILKLQNEADRLRAKAQEVRRGR
jgi:N-methylhydantoinase B/oxoprolinase/acetone carboxylase alpha subunit